MRSMQPILDEVLACLSALCMCMCVRVYTHVCGLVKAAGQPCGVWFLRCCSACFFETRSLPELELSE